MLIHVGLIPRRVVGALGLLSLVESYRARYAI
jgi:hypothetical protein